MRKDTSGDVVEHGDDAFRKIRELHERWNQRFRLDDPRLIERYRDGRLVIHVHFRVGAEEYCAIVHGERMDHGVRLWITRNHKRQDCRQGHSIRGCELLCEANGYQQAVFVNDVEFVETPQGVIPSLVWLQGIDALHQCIRKAVYLSTTGRFVFVGTFGDGKTMFSRPLPDGRGRHNAIDQVIERRSQAVQNVSCEAKNVVENRLSDIQTFPWSELFSLRIDLFDNLVRVRLEETANKIIEVFDVLVGPFNLDPRIALPLVTKHDSENKEGV